ncbi:adenylate kinase 8 isoform X2 [Sphaeramia orbicularis]|uniref:adenylate kinase 8 isoform X2 n=1 Tax=Sphaeramia orbicularis TaxID=375764 RepID=UPI00117CC9DA|nr:adenylate kinase 8 isoform X2 [Sphaeramia orbicularis]
MRSWSSGICDVVLMDETVKPVRVPLQMSTYADRHHLFHLMEILVSGLIVHRPDDPISWLIHFLQRSRIAVPRVLLLGPPAVGKHTVVTQLCAELRAVHVTMDSLLTGQSELSCQSEQDFPAEPLVKRIQQRLSEVDCLNQGWVLEGIPQTRLQALSLQQAGVFPEHVVLLEAPDDVLMDRSRGRLVDPLTGDIYHHTFILPSDQTVAQRLEKGRSLSEAQLLVHLHRYRREVAGLSSAYKDVLKVINSDQPQADVYQQVLSFVRTRHRSRTPRILLLGPPGSGKSHLARQLSEKYKMVDVCCGRLLRSAAAQSSAVGDQVRPYVEDGRPVPDSVVLQILQDRLSRVDCSCRGWVLHGFPSDLQQARGLQETQHQPNRVFFLELTDDVCVDRLSLRSTDPVTGHRFHAVTRPAPSTDVHERLQTHPADRRGAVTLRLNQYRANDPGLKSVYPDAVHIDADQDPHSVFEAVESRLTTD